MKNWIKTNRLYFIGAILGAIAGFLYWNYIGCLDGSCAITSNPYKSTAYFAMMGALALGIFKKEKQPIKETSGENLNS